MAQRQLRVHWRGLIWTSEMTAYMSTQHKDDRWKDDSIYLGGISQVIDNWPSVSCTLRYSVEECTVVLAAAKQSAMICAVMPRVQPC